MKSTQEVTLKVKEIVNFNSLDWKNKVLIGGIKRLDVSAWSYYKEQDGKLEFVTGYAPGIILSLKIEKNLEYISDGRLNVQNKNYDLKRIDLFNEKTSDYDYYIREATITGNPNTYLLALRIKGDN